MTIYDPTPAQIEDLGANFLLTEDHVNKKIPRAKAVISQLCEMNPYVKISTIEDKEINIETIKNYSVVCISELIIPLEKIHEINKKARENKRGFVMALALGVTGTVFVDFGDEHIVKDEDGKSPDQFLIKFIAKGKETKIYFDKEYPVEEGQKIKIYNVIGMNEINGKQAKIIKVEKEWVIIDLDSTNFSNYDR